jgi:Uma2 family endonuclease
MNGVVGNPLKITARQFEDMARKGAFATVGRVELRQGMMTLMSPIHLKHSDVATALLFALKEALTACGSGLRLNMELSANLDQAFVPITDIVIWDPTPVAPDHDGPLPKAAVKLAIEVASQSLQDDLGDKMREYAAAGVAEYWVADVQGRLMHVHHNPGPEGYQTRAEVPFGQPVTSPTLGLTVETSGL